MDHYMTDSADSLYTVRSFLEFDNVDYLFDIYCLGSVPRCKLDSVVKLMEDETYVLMYKYEYRKNHGMD